MKLRKGKVPLGSHLIPQIDKLPSLRSIEKDRNPLIHVRLFSPWGHGAWYVAAADRDTRRISIHADDYIMLVYADLGFPEWGTTSLREIENLRIGPLGLRVEQDEAFEPSRFDDLFPQLAKRKG